MDAAFAFLGDSQRATRAFPIAGKSLVIDFDAPALAERLFIAFGRGHEPTVEDRDRAFMTVLVRREPGDLLSLAIHCRGRGVSPAEMFFGTSHPDCPYAIMPKAGGSVVVFRDRGIEQFWFDDANCRVFPTDVWPEAVVSVVMRLFRRLADDTVFLHSSAVSVGDRALLFVGPPRSGKTTVALALAARGHDLLSDEFGCYVPADDFVYAFRRPAGLRPGPRAAVIEAALARGCNGIDDGESRRVDPSDLVNLQSERPAKLHAVVFLDGFSADPLFRDVVAGSAEVRLLGAADVSLSDRTATRRIFDLMQLLSRSRVGYLEIGDPDRTAILLEETFRR